MNVNLSSKQRRWLEAEVSAGRFASVDEAVEMAVSALMAIEADDFAWAKPKVDAARASVARGEIVSGDDYLKSLDEHIAATRSS
jgi:Arc/MetJ-type ribon-helix-helix transcriptional regulator